MLRQAVKSFLTFNCLFESLILAQDERWRRV